MAECVIVVDSNVLVDEEGLAIVHRRSSTMETYPVKAPLCSAHCQGDTWEGCHCLLSLSQRQTKVFCAAGVLTVSRSYWSNGVN